MALRRMVAVVTKCALVVGFISLWKHVGSARWVMFTTEPILYVEPLVGDTSNALWYILVFVSSGNVSPKSNTVCGAACR